jgi:biopolymer transport protein ExbD
MKISGQKSYLLSLESVAMTDIVLNMFIFFFISFSLLYTFSPHRVQRLKVKLPEARSATAPKGMSQTCITITNEGLIYLDKEVVTLEGLRDKISQLHKNNPELSVMLYSDKLVQFQNVVSVLDLLATAGIRNLDIAAASKQ